MHHLGRLPGGLGLASILWMLWIVPDEVLTALAQLVEPLSYLGFGLIVSVGTLAGGVALLRSRRRGAAAA